MLLPDTYWAFEICPLILLLLLFKHILASQGSGGGLFTKSCLTLGTPWTVWDLSHPGIEPKSPVLQAQSLLTCYEGTPKVKVKVAQSCLTLCHSMDYTVHGILQARILEWVAFPFSRGSSQPRDRTQVSTLQVGSLPVFLKRMVEREGVRGSGRNREKTSEPLALGLSLRERRLRP